MGQQKGRPDSPEPVSEYFGPVDQIVTHPSKNVYILFIYLFIYCLYIKMFYINKQIK